jgi:hypothetical protein
MSHYVIWRDRIFLFGQYEDDLDTSPQADESAHLIDVVRERLSIKEWSSFAEVAAALETVPWDVLAVCRRLVRMGIAREGKGKLYGCFRRV